MRAVAPLIWAAFALTVGFLWQHDAGEPAYAQGPPANPPFTAHYFNFHAFVQSEAGANRYYFHKSQNAVTTTSADGRPCAYWTIVNKNAVTLTVIAYVAPPVKSVSPALILYLQPNQVWPSNGIALSSISISTTNWGATPDSLLVSVED